jgi:hypothetical protein
VRPARVVDSASFDDFVIGGVPTLPLLDALRQPVGILERRLGCSPGA